MTDSVLRVRIEALEETLRHVQQDERSLADCIQLGAPRLEELKKGLDRAIRTQVRRRLEELKSSREKLDKLAETEEDDAKQELLEEAWEGYARTCERSGKFFSECLEIVGGLVFRSLGMQDRIYILADELTRQCADDVLKSSVALTLPSLPETMVKTLARIIGLRFPDWTIWNLPMTAHELGHVLMQEDEFLAEFVQGLVSTWDGGGSERQVDRYVHELVADAFGTYIMGPAYACSAVLLAFDPLAAHREEEGRPSDAKRAHVVFTMLRLMPDTKDEYEFQIQQVEEEWQAMVRGVGQPEKLEEDEATRLEKLASDIKKGFEDELRISAKYPSQGWLLAKTWGESLEQALKKKDYEGMTIKREAIPATSRLRDVLNAAWFCRLQRCKLNRSGEVALIADAAHDLCDGVRDVRRDAKKEGSQVRISLPSLSESQR